MSVTGHCSQAQAIVAAAQTSLAAGSSAAFVSDYASRSGASGSGLSAALGATVTDGCPSDDDKTSPGACGCGNAELVPCSGDGGGGGDSDNTLTIALAVAAGVLGVAFIGVLVAAYWPGRGASASRDTPLSPRAPTKPPPPALDNVSAKHGNAGSHRPNGSPSTAFSNPLLRASPGPAAGGASGAGVGPGAAASGATLQFARTSAASRLSAKVRGGSESSMGGSTTVIQVASPQPGVPSAVLPVGGQQVVGAVGAAPGDADATAAGGQGHQLQTRVASGRRQFKLESIA